MNGELLGRQGECVTSTVVGTERGNAGTSGVGAFWDWPPSMFNGSVALSHSKKLSRPGDARKLTACITRPRHRSKPKMELVFFISYLRVGFSH
jgi:hypothetical protein